MTNDQKIQNLKNIFYRQIMWFENFKNDEEKLFYASSEVLNQISPEDSILILRILSEEETVE